MPRTTIRAGIRAARYGPARVMARRPGTESRERAVEEALATLPERYLGGPDGLDAVYRITFEDLGCVWEVRLGPDAATVRDGAGRRRPDVEISTDAATWLALRRGALSGVDAFAARRLRARGDLDLAVAFESFFRRPGGRGPRLRLRRLALGGGRDVSVLTLGRGPDVVLVHGLGGTKSSFFETAAALAAGGHRVHALDLPGFGASSKPLRAPYDAPWFAAAVLDAMDALGVARAGLAGNSMGGRVAIEAALAAPERVAGIALLCPAVAFPKRTLHPLVALLRPELGLLPHAIPRALVARQLWSLFGDREAIDAALADVVVDGFRRTYASAGARHAFLASARNLYLEAPFGRRGFYPRLAGLRTPALFVWGSEDRLVPAALRHVVYDWLPHARQTVLEGCGHVPQVERPDEVNPMLLRFFGRCLGADAAGPAASPSRAELAA